MGLLAQYHSDSVLRHPFSPYKGGHACSGLSAELYHNDLSYSLKIKLLKILSGMYSNDCITSTSCPIWDLHVRMNLYSGIFYFSRVNSAKYVPSSLCWDLPFILQSEIFKKHAQATVPHMLIELFKQFVIDRYSLKSSESIQYYF